MSQFNQGIDLDYEIKKMEPGLNRAVLRVLQPRVGREMSISRRELVSALEQLGFGVSERRVRAVIGQLRKDGQLICSTGGHNGGYWLARNWAELREFVSQEVLPRAMTLLATKSALEKAAQSRWGVEQPRLFS